MDARTIEETARLLEALGWLIAGGLIAWFAFGTLVCVVGRVAPSVRVVRAAARWSPAIARRMAGITCSASVLLSAPAVAHAANRSPVETIVADEPIVRMPQAPETEPEPIPEPAPLAAPEPAAEIPTPDIYVVAPGDNLWQIARAQLGGDRAPDEIAPYWRAVVEANRSTLRSGDPSLIYPGEAITLPPPPQG